MKVPFEIGFETKAERDQFRIKMSEFAEAMRKECKRREKGLKVIEVQIESVEFGDGQMTLDAKVEDIFDAPSATPTTPASEEEDPAAVGFATAFAPSLWVVAVLALFV